MKTIEELISNLPELILYQGQEKAFLEITASHVYYSKIHDNQGNLSCVYIVCGGDLRLSLERANQWIREGLREGKIKILS